jgi:hypothetical protein
MNRKEKQQYKQGLSVMTTNELVEIIIDKDIIRSLVEIIIDQDERLTIYEEKERYNTKQGKGE